MIERGRSTLRGCLRALGAVAVLSAVVVVVPDALSQPKPTAAAKAPAKKPAKKAKGAADGGTDAAPVRPTQESEIWTGNASDAGAVAVYVPPPPRKVAPPPPRPTPEQLKGLEQLQTEATDFS